MRRECPQCGAANVGTQAACLACGTALPAVAACASCGEELDAGDRFCTACGAAVGPAAALPVCPACGTPGREGGRFCGACGTPFQPGPATATAAEPLPEPEPEPGSEPEVAHAHALAPEAEPPPADASAHETVVQRPEVAAGPAPSGHDVQGYPFAELADPAAATRVQPRQALVPLPAATRIVPPARGPEMARSRPRAVRAGNVVGALAGVAVAVSTALHWLGSTSAFDRRISVLTDPGGTQSGVKLGLVVLAAGLVIAAIALVPRVGLLRRLGGLVAAGLALVFAAQIVRYTHDGGASVGTAVDLLGPGVWTCLGAGLVAALAP